MTAEPKPARLARLIELYGERMAADMVAVQDQLGPYRTQPPKPPKEWEDAAAPIMLRFQAEVEAAARRMTADLLKIDHK